MNEKQESNYEKLRAKRNAIGYHKKKGTGRPRAICTLCGSPRDVALWATRGGVRAREAHFPICSGCKAARAGLGHTATYDYLQLIRSQQFSGVPA